MPRDYAKNRPGSHSGRDSHSRSGGSSGIVWLLIGVLIGLVIAGIFYIKNPGRNIYNKFVPSAGTPVISSSEPPKAILSQAQTATPQSVSPQSAKKPAKSPSANQNLQTQFDFYDVLPSKKVMGPGGDEDTSEIQNSPPTSVSPSPPTPSAATIERSVVQPIAPPAQKSLPPVIQGVPTAAPKASSKPSVYIVQVAALSNAGDADQLKAQLTLLGFEVKITPGVPHNGKRYYRVWLGPFHTAAQAESTQKQLQENMISAKVLKTGL